MTIPTPRPGESVIQAADAVRDRASLRIIHVGAPTEGDADAYLKRHIDGAVYVAVRGAFSGAASPENGNLPLPSAEQLAAALAAAGISPSDDIVVYAAAPAWAARAWWVLRWAGIKARVLDGGLAAWERAGGPTASGATEAPAVPVSALDGGHANEVGLEDVLASLGARTLVDARDPAAFAAGHIPGAINLPSSQLWDDAGKLKDRAAIQTALQVAGINAGDDVVAYCGGGVLATWAALALESAGVSPAVYVGSWSQWSANPDTPRATGAAT